MALESFTKHFNARSIHVLCVFENIVFPFKNTYTLDRAICAAVCVRFDIPVSKAKYAFCDFTSVGEEGSWNQNWYLPFE